MSLLFHRQTGADLTDFRCVSKHTRQHGSGHTRTKGWNECATKTHIRLVGMRNNVECSACLQCKPAGEWFGNENIRSLIGYAGFFGSSSKRQLCALGLLSCLHEQGRDRRPLEYRTKTLVAQQYIKEHRSSFQNIWREIEKLAVRSTNMHSRSPRCISWHS